MAAAVIPLAAMIGSGVDMSRTYMVKSRLQQACDAGALAGRRAMTGTTLDSAASTQANNFFNFNFPTGVFGTTGTSFTPAATSDGQLTATAATTLPMTIMAMFGKETTQLSVSCEARYEISNADVMFVLDVTGSMNCAASDTSSTCSNNGNVEKSNARIKALRLAVVSFYDTLNTAVSSTARLRIGFVPYASGVNVGGLLPAAYLRDSAPYQSRVANYTTAQYVETEGTPSAPVQEIYSGGTGISKSNCTKYGRNESFSGFSGGSNPVVSGGPIPAPTTDKTYYNNTDDAGVDWGWSGAPDTSGNNKSCRRYYTTTTSTYTARYAFTNWTYREETYDTSSYKTGGSVTLALGKDGTVATSGSYNAQQLAALTVGTTGRMGVTTTTSSWSAQCIEERDTVSNATFSSIPSTAYDLDIDLVPSSDATRWRPVWSAILFDRNTSGTSTAAENTSTTRSSESHACPKAASKLAVRTHDDVYNYVNASDFKAISNTYHDIGLIWGARLISETGIFGSENNSAPNGKPISRHLIFMTDGDMLPNRDIYGMYGLERLDRRITGSGTVPTDSDLKTRHNSRFSAICNAIKGKNITLWVVAYAQTMTTELQNCADSGKAYYASNDAELTAQFNRIAAQIAELRLSQ
jgi:Flp pilus assembly protein TadG